MLVDMLLYGANGYTGTLIAEEAVRRGTKPVLAGRRAEAVRALAERLGLDWLAFPLDDRAALERAVAEAPGRTVLLAAGPFSATSRPVVDACLRVGAHYLDITGEVDIFEACAARGEEARTRSVTLLPGVGFDVVPSDCLAASLKAALPDAVRLELAFTSAGRPSAGTARTMIEALPKGGLVRAGGRLVREPVAARERLVPFADRPRACVSIPWGDVSTAYYSTGIPDIVVYTPWPPRMTKAVRLARPLLPLAGLGPVQAGLKVIAGWTAKGSSEEARRTGVSQFWGRVENAAGAAVEGTLRAPEGYALTALTAVESARRAAAGETRPGVATPSLAFGARYIEQFEGCELRIG